MIIDFDKMELQHLTSFKGGEKELAANMFFDGENRVLRGTLVPGATIGLHKHEGNCEMIFITSGTGTVLMDGAYETVKAGVCHYCPEGHEHSLINNSNADLTFLAVVPKQ
ncbi:MAG: cupin domain-containing protein [Clostridia bacterium]|nr:cupin domain-containing protein [Clostridia bacterium]NLS84205.1 cupin domain-containing protein [Oscillospiraceae bacterium]